METQTMWAVFSGGSLLSFLAYVALYPRTMTKTGTLFWLLLWPVGVALGLAGLIVGAGEDLRRKLEPDGKARCAPDDQNSRRETGC